MAHLDWGVCTTVPSCESRANADLVSVGFSTYYPRYESVEAVRGQIVRRTRPLFPGYIFFGLIDLWRSVFDSERVIGVLMADDERPSHLPQEVIDELRERESADGVIKFNVPRKRRYAPGTKVTIRHGVMTGLVGVVHLLQAHERVQVLLDMLGRGTTVSVREAEITAA
jgi:transcriptional antiterminator RfaH